MVSSDWVICYVAEQNKRDDAYEGPVPEHIGQYDSYELVQLLISSTDVLGNEYSPSLAMEYSLMPGETAPPVVFDQENGWLIDGFHRTQAALLRGDTTVLAYVGRK